MDPDEFSQMMEEMAEQVSAWAIDETLAEACVDLALGLTLGYQAESSQFYIFGQN